MDYNGKTTTGATLAATGVVNVWLAFAAGAIILAIALAIRFGWRTDKSIDQ